MITRCWLNPGQLQGPGHQWAFDTWNCPGSQRGGGGGNLRCLGVFSPILLCVGTFLLSPPLAQLKYPALEGALPMILPPSPSHHHLVLLLLHLLPLLRLPAHSYLLSHSNSTFLWHNSAGSAAPRSEWKRGRVVDTPSPAGCFDPTDRRLALHNLVQATLRGERRIYAAAAYAGKLMSENRESHTLLHRIYLPQIFPFCQPLNHSSEI